MNTTRVLILGGNRFIGKILASTLDPNIYDVTVMNRSGTGPEGVHKLKCDRDDVTQFKQILQSCESFDIIVDMCAYNERQVRELEESLTTLPNNYVFMSSLATGKLQFGDYGKNKQEAEDYLITKSKLPYSIIRPGYLVGFEDPYQRVQTYSIALSSGEKVPMPKQPLQEISITDSVQLVDNVMSIMNLCNSRGIFLPQHYKTTPFELSQIVSNKLGIHLEITCSQTAPFDTYLESEMGSTNKDELQTIIERYAS